MIIRPVPLNCPFWSVIIPLYERRQFLQQCLNSILDQDPGPEEMEILVVDDASPSDLRGFVEGLGRGRVQYLRNDTNLGERANTNRAIGRARAGGFTSCTTTTGFYRASTPPCGKGSKRRRNLSAWLFACMRPGMSGAKPGGRRNRSASAGLMDRSFVVRLAQACPLNLCAVIYHRTAFEKVGWFREDLPQTAEWEWYVRSALQFDWHHQPETLACYRIHNDNLTHNQERIRQNARDFRRALEAIAELLPEDLKPLAIPQAQEFHGRQLFQSALRTMHAGNAELANWYALEGLVIDPMGPGRPEFATLLREPGFDGLRERIRLALLREHGD